MAKLAWKVYDFNEGKLKESFNKSKKFDYSNGLDGLRKISVYNSDITGTNDYSVIVIERDYNVECLSELRDQLKTGVLKDSNPGRQVLISNDELYFLEMK